MDGRLRMEKCGWKIAHDIMQMIKSLWGKINLRCFLKVLFVNKPSHLIELRSGEVHILFSIPSRSKHFKASTPNIFILPVKWNLVWSVKFSNKNSFCQSLLLKPLEISLDSLAFEVVSRIILWQQYKHFFRVYMASSKHLIGWENSRKMCKSLPWWRLVFA